MKKKILLLCVISIFLLTNISPSLAISTNKKLNETFTNPLDSNGPFLVGWVEKDIDSSNGGSLSIAVYYPSIVAGENVQPNTDNNPYPTVVLSTDFLSKIDFYRPLAAKIASWGFICIIIGSEQLSFVFKRKTDLIDTLNWLDEENDISFSKLYQLIDESKIGAIGHSLGGTASVMATGSESRIKALVTIAPFVFDIHIIVFDHDVLYLPSADDIYIPFLITVGSRELICFPPSMSYPLYNSANPSKFCLTIKKYNHYDIVMKSSKYIISFLMVYLYEDAGYATYLYGEEAQQEIQNGKINLMYEL